MDQKKLLNKVRTKENIELAYNYALNDRIKNDSYFDHFEIEYVIKYKQEILAEILAELKSPSSFQGRFAYTYYLAKNNLCYRRMIYLPFKDLVIRYAFVIVLANYLDLSLSGGCFANRRAKGKDAKKFLLEDYYKIAVAKFKNWQKKCADKYQVLIRTDISSFYDSVSHQYLIKTLAQQLSIDVNSEFLQLFTKLLSPKVISYSHKTKKVQEPQTLRQGLIIGNNSEGFLANLYLRDVDEAMQEAGIEFGRYNDDMRIFAENRQKAHLYLLILQEHLLSKGLNLNASKTLIAENKEEIEKLRTKLYDESSVGFDDPYLEIQGTEYGELLVTKNEIEKHIDKEFTLNDLWAEFAESEQLMNDKDAKKICNLIQNHLPKEYINESHINQLQIILTHWQGCSKQAAWLLVRSTYDSDISQETKTKALKVLLKVLSSEETLSYGKYRIIHHLVNSRKDKFKQQYRLVDTWESKFKKELREILLELLQKTAFELNIIALYALKKLGDSQTEIEKYVKKYIPKPLGEPILNAILYSQELQKLQDLVKLNEINSNLDNQWEEATDYESEEGGNFY